LLWSLRLCVLFHRPLAELDQVLTAAEIGLWMAMVEIDGPWWGEREAALLRQLCSVQAAAAGADLPPDQFRVEWVVGESAASSENLLPPDDGLEILAARYGVPVAVLS
jgi:hypothetical protein